nr:LptF/LptG family permease [Vampirovibrio sp.]
TPITSPRLEDLSHAKGLKNVKAPEFTFVEKRTQGNSGRLKPDKFLHIGNVDEFEATGELSDFIILYYKTLTNGEVIISRILKASQGSWDLRQKVWRLLDGVEYELSDEGVYRHPRRFDEQLVSTSRYPYQLLKYSLERPKDMGFAKLSEYVQLLKEGGQLQDVRFFEVRLAQKWILPLASVFFAVIGVFLGVERPRSKYQYALISAAVVLFFYSVMIPFSTNLGGLGVLDPILIGFIPLLTALVAAFGALSIRKWIEGF